MEMSMAKLISAPVDRLADHFVNYLFDEYKGTRHVRRISSWIGLILLGIGRLSDSEWEIPRSRQLRFKYNGQRYKVRYKHDVGSRGGIEIVELLPLQGLPEGDRIVVITSLAQAEAFYLKPDEPFRAR